MKVKVILVLILTSLCHLSLQEDESDGRVRVKVPVKRVLSRQRRYFAPGARWDTLFGWETLTDSFDIHFYLLIKYYMDYLFGGQAAYNALVAANNAANTAFVSTKAASLASATAASSGLFVGATGLPAGSPTGISPGKRRRRNSKEDEYPFKIEDDVSNVLTRTLADDQVHIFEKIEESLNRTGLPGRQCILRAVCELKETPIDQVNLFGETITMFLTPKSDDHSKLEDFKKAEKIGSEKGHCWSFYPDCPYSIFNLIPGLSLDGHAVEYEFDKFESGSGFSHDGVGEQDFSEIFKEMKLQSFDSKTV